MEPCNKIDDATQHHASDTAEPNVRACDPQSAVRDKEMAKNTAGYKSGEDVIEKTARGTTGC